MQCSVVDPPSPVRQGASAKGWRQFWQHSVDATMCVCGEMRVRRATRRGVFLAITTLSPALMSDLPGADSNSIRITDDGGTTVLTTGRTQYVTAVCRQISSCKVQASTVLQHHGYKVLVPMATTS